MMIPKSLLSLLVVVAATFSVAATDLFHIEDFTIQPGETELVAILLENQAEYTSFQTDLYLPEGLTINQQSVALTDRKASDHIIATSILPNGALRIMSYSMRVLPYSGNSGALVTFQITASETFQGPVTLAMNNIVFTTVAGKEVAFDDTDCTVNTIIIGDANHDGLVNITDATTIINYLLKGDASLIDLAAADLNGDSMVNITDVTVLINKLIRGNNS